MIHEGHIHHSMTILLVEDNPADVRLTQEAFIHSKMINEIVVVEDGVEAMAFLHGTPPYEERRLPDIIILDLNLPRKNGREVLIEIKTDHALRRIPVIVLTTSNAEEDILSCYSNYANCYITKPVNMDEFFNIAEAIEQFWFQITQLPINK